jgi:hypothetical protein
MRLRMPTPGCINDAEAIISVRNLHCMTALDLHWPSAIAAVARYVEAIGCQIQISAVFGDDHYVFGGTVTEAA